MKTTNSDVFFQFLKLEGDQIQLAEGALLIAKDVYPELDIDFYLQQLDQMAAELQVYSLMDYFRHVSNFCKNVLTRCMRAGNLRPEWNEGMEEWEIRSCHHPSILPTTKNTKKFLKHAVYFVKKRP